MTNYYYGKRVQSQEKHATIINFLKHLLKYWYVIILIASLAVGAAYVYTTYFMTPTYRSTAKLYILNKQTENITTTELTISNLLSKDYMELIEDDVILEPVATALNHKYSSSQLRSFLSISNPENTRFLVVTATCPNPEDAKEIVDSVCEISQEIFVEILNADRVNIISKGKIPHYPSSPNLFNNLLVGGMGGAALAVGIIFIIFLLNDTIKYAEDVERALDLNVLATIPYSQSSKTYY